MDNIDQDAVGKEAIAEHYNSLTEDEQKSFDALSDEEKKVKNEEVYKKAVSDNKSQADDKVPLATMLEYKKQAKENAEKLAKYEQEAKIKREEEMAKKGEYKELLETKSTELENLANENASLKEQLLTFTKGIDEKVEQFVNSITDEADKTIVETILNGKNASEKAKLLPSLEKKFGTPDNINNGVKGGSQKPPTNEIKIEELKKKIEKAVTDGKPMDVLKLQSQLRTLTN